MGKVNLIVETDSSNELRKIGCTSGGNYDLTIDWFRTEYSLYGFVHPVFYAEKGVSKYTTKFGYTISGVGENSSSTRFKTVKGVKPMEYLEAREQLIRNLISLVNK